MYSSWYFYSVTKVFSSAAHRKYTRNPFRNINRFVKILLEYPIYFAVHYIASSEHKTLAVNKSETMACVLFMKYFKNNKNVILFHEAKVRSVQYILSKMQPFIFAMIYWTLCTCIGLVLKTLPRTNLPKTLNMVI